MSATVARLTSDWTERHTAVALALAVAGLAGAAAAREPSPYWAVGAVAVIGTAVLGLRLDPFGGIVAGVGGAAAVIAAKQLSGGWTTASFLTSLATTTAVVALGWVAGAASGRLRERVAGGAAPGVVAPVYGSLGLISGDLAVARLDEEMARARSHRRPLTLVLLRSEITDEGLGDAGRHAALRSVARLVETLLRETDVPFALGLDEVGAILPETDAAAAWDLVGPLAESITAATFSVRDADERRSFADTAELQVGLVVMGAEHATGADLLAEARRAVDDGGAAGGSGSARDAGGSGVVRAAGLDPVPEVQR